MTASSPAIPAALIQSARDLIAAANRVLIVAHMQPDGDAIGSLLGLGLVLRAAGKEVVLGCDDPAPENFRFLPGAGEITPEPGGEFDLIIAVDVSDARRMGAIGARLGRPPHILLDHHLTNQGFAAVNLLDAEAASTGELVTELLEPLGLPLPQPAATCLLAGVLLTADCLSEEKRDGTLGLLFLTDLKGYDVVLGKFIAMSLNAIYGLLAILPITGLPLLMGGVTGGEFWRMNLALLNALFVSLAMGVCVSAFGRESQRVMGVTLVLLVLLAGGLPALAAVGRASRFSPAWNCNGKIPIPTKFER